MKILSIIPARGGSKSIPKKNIKIFAGKPLIVHTIEDALKSKYINRIIVSTEDKEIEKIAENYGAEVINRPKKFAKDDSPTIDVIFHVLDVLNKENYHPDIIVLLQVTSPLRKTEDIDEAIELFLNSKNESVVSVSDVKHPPFWSLKIDKGYLRPLFGNKYMKIRRQDMEKTLMPNGAIYISTPETLYKYKSYYCDYTIPYIIPNERSIDIDNELDFIIAEFLFKKYKSR